MNFADLESLWRSPHNQPTAAQREAMRTQFIADLRRRRRGNLLFLFLTGLPLVIFTVLVVRHVFWPDPAHAPVDLSREWAILPLYALPWIGWLYIIRLHRRHCARFRNLGESVSRSLAALIDENRSERARYRFIGALLLASVVILPLIVLQLRQVGKAGNEIFLPFLILFPALLLGIVGWMALHYRRKLVPRQRQLETLLADYRRQEAVTPERQGEHGGSQGPM